MLCALGSACSACLELALACGLCGRNSCCLEAGPPEHSAHARGAFAKLIRCETKASACLRSLSPLLHRPGCILLLLLRCGQDRLLCISLAAPGKAQWLYLVISTQAASGRLEGAKVSIDHGADRPTEAHQKVRWLGCIFPASPQSIQGVGSRAGLHHGLRNSRQHADEGALGSRHCSTLNAALLSVSLLSLIGLFLGMKARSLGPFHLPMQHQTTTALNVQTSS